MNDFSAKSEYDLNDLRNIIKYLRSGDGCSWDRVQTHESIRPNLIEETYEVIEAIDNDDNDLMREELGDLLMQIVFHAQIEEELGSFTLDDVISDVSKKLIRRHPNVFSGESRGEQSSDQNFWEESKKKEKKRLTVTDSMRAVPPSLPALMRCSSVIRKAMKDGYNFGTELEIFKKISYDADRLLNGRSFNIDVLEGELCELLFDTSVLSTLFDIDLEEKVNKKIRGFIEKYPKI